MNLSDDCSKTSLKELALLFVRLGFTAFGGPAAHVALMEDEVVTRRRWIDRQHFLDLVAAMNFIPGPNSTELAIHIGQLRAGWKGLIVAGGCFIGPAMLIILPIAWAYTRWGALPQVQPVLHGIAAAIAAVVLFVTLRFTQTAIKSPLSIALMVLTLIGSIAATRYEIPQSELLALALCAAAGAIAQHSRRQQTMPLLTLGFPPLFWEQIARLAGILLKIGATLFGSGYVLISYLQSDLVDRRGWLNSQELIDAIAVGQFTPGPLLTTASFIGYLLGHGRFSGGTAGGILGGIVATFAIFLPSFIIVAAFGRLVQRIRANPLARGALDGMNAAVVALMIVASARLVYAALWIAPPGRVHRLGAMLFVGCLIGLWRRINATWLILASALIAGAWQLIRL